MSGGMVMLAAPAASATPGDPHKVWICHATSSDSNPYVAIHVDVASKKYEGHLQHRNTPNKSWKSDGTWNNVDHSAGSAKPDYIEELDFDNADWTDGAPCNAPGIPEKDCVDSGQFTHTYNGTNAGTVTLTTEDDKPLCSPFYVRAAAWTYDGAGDWPQTLKGSNLYEIDEPGDFTYVAPTVTCGQYDIYAGWGENSVDIPDHLTGPNNPYEPEFLHDYSKGPKPTYFMTSHANCEEPPREIDIPEPPTVSEPDCDSAGSFTVAPHEGMTTFLDGVKVTESTLVDKAGDYTIGYIANPGTVFESTGKTRATQDLTVPPATGDCPPGQIDIPAPPNVSAPDCDSAGSFTVTPHDGMTTFLDGVKVTAPTVVSVAGKYTIGYVAGPDTVFNGTGKTRATQEVVVPPPTGNCPTTQTRPVPPAPVPTAPACDVDGSLTLPVAADGLTWAIQQISGTTDNSSPYGPGVYRVTVTSSGLPFSTGGQSYTYPDITVAPNTGPCIAGVQEIAPTVTFKNPTCEKLNRAKWSGNLTDLVDYTVSGTPGRGNSVTVTANIKPAVADQFAFADGFDNTFDHSYPSKADLKCATVKGSESSRPKPHTTRTPTVLGTQAVAPTAVDAGLASLPGDSATSTASLLAQLMVAGGLLLLLAGGWLGLGRREDGAHQA